MLQNIFLVVHVLIAIILVGIILIQHGKGADAGAAFGSGASQTVFGASGSTSFMTRLTTGLAIAFFATSLTLAYFTNARMESTSVTDVVPQQVPDIPASDIPTSGMPMRDAPGSGTADKSASSSADKPKQQQVPGDVPSDVPSDVSSDTLSESLDTPKP
ncbi:MAG: hypothetical protein BMS9Abin26_1306 [Gammaproteobacteria bacterium]|nr:MAG: hypothetical protein BMS9Abin26_1306 [Gammaproteobacteria bacterium]